MDHTYFNPQQDMVDRGVQNKQYCLRYYQDVLAFFVLSHMLPTAEEKQVNQTLKALDKSHQNLEKNIGYRPDSDRKPEEDNSSDIMTQSQKIMAEHPFLTLTYHLTALPQSCTRDWDMGAHISYSLQGGMYFRTWQDKQRERT